MLKFRKYTVIAIVYSIIGLMGTSRPSPAAEGSLVRANYSGISDAFAPVWIALDKGLFAKYGLNLDLRFIAPATSTRRGAELPARLKSAAGQPMNFATVCSQHAIVGDSQTAVRELKDLANDTRATHFLTWFNIGSVPHALVEESMRQFAAEVMTKI